MKILLFDDHRLFGESLKKLLIESQFVSLCYYVERENDFFRTFREKEFDIILLDINLRIVLKRMDLKYWQIYYQLIQIQK